MQWLGSLSLSWKAWTQAPAATSICFVDVSLSKTLTDHCFFFLQLMCHSSKLSEKIRRVTDIRSKIAFQYAYCDLFNHCQMQLFLSSTVSEVLEEQQSAKLQTVSANTTKITDVLNGHQRISRRLPKKCRARKSDIVSRISDASHVQHVFPSEWGKST